MTPKNMRILHYWNGTYTKLTLRVGKPINLYAYQTTEEGWNSDKESITLHEDGSVTLEHVNDGRDCDGRMTRGAEYIMDGFTRTEVEVEQSAILVKSGVRVYNSFQIPYWKEASSHQRDEYAEAAGY